MTLDTDTLIKALGALGAVLLLLWGAANVARLGGKARGAGRRMVVQEVLALDSRRRLVLIRCDDRELLLMTGGPEAAVVGWLPGQPAP